VWCVVPGVGAGHRGREKSAGTGEYIQSHACWLKTSVSGTGIGAENAEELGEEVGSGVGRVEWRFEEERRSEGVDIYIAQGPCATLADCVRAQAPAFPYRNRAPLCYETDAQLRHQSDQSVSFNPACFRLPLSDLQSHLF
jgi:hypothetical protein